MENDRKSKEKKSKTKYRHASSSHVQTVHRGCVCATRTVCTGLNDCFLSASFYFIDNA